MKSVLMVGLLVALASVASAQTSDLIISEYVEGSGDNRAIEIFNGTADAINLSGYTLERYSNGATTPVVIPLNAVDLPARDVFVLVHPLAHTILLALSNQTDANLVFSGDDALVLAFGGVPVDCFGRVGEDPGEFWSCPEGNTQNHTLRRQPGVCSGDTVKDDPFDPCLEWIFDPIDTFVGIGHHSDDCGSVDTGDTSWGALKASFR